MDGRCPSRACAVIITVGRLWLGPALLVKNMDDVGLYIMAKERNLGLPGALGRGIVRGYRSVVPAKASDLSLSAQAAMALGRGR